MHAKCEMRLGVLINPVSMSLPAWVCKSVTALQNVTICDVDVFSFGYSLYHILF